MKTPAIFNQSGIKIRFIVVLLSLIPMLTGFNGHASEILLPMPQAEKAVNDIPFDTHEIAINYFFTQAMAGVELPAESYVNDIPFETSVVIANLKDKSTSKSDLNLRNFLPEIVMNRFNNILKAGLISILILLSASILGFLYFSYVY